MTTQTLVKPQQDRVAPDAIIDCDVHNWSEPADLAPFLSQRWSSYLKRFGTRTMSEGVLVRVREYGARADSHGPDGRPPGNDPDFVREQLLDAYDIDAAILNPLAGNVQQFIGGNQPREFSCELMTAVNRWNLESWIVPDSRWYGSVCIPFEYAEESAVEIDRCRSESDRFLQALVSMRTADPLGNQKYWPMYEALEHHGMPMALHPGGSGLGMITACGWPSFYVEDHIGYPQALMNHMTSLICEGAFERFPNLKVVFVEGGWSWVPAFGRRFDSMWEMLREEVPHLTRKPSDYIRRHFHFTTQPMEEPERPELFMPVLEQFRRFGLLDHLMFSSDYYHWDFDHPEEALPKSIPSEILPNIMYRNAQKLYGIELPEAVA